MKSSIDLGVKAFKEGRFADAIAFLESSTKYHSENFKLWLMLARAYQRDFQLEKASEAYQTVLSGCSEDPLIQVARQGLATVEQELSAARNRPKELFCPECGTPIPLPRHASPWCLCGWSNKGNTRSSHGTILYLKDLQLHCRKHRIKIYLKRKNDIYVVTGDGVELQGLGTRTFPVDPRLAFPLKERLAFINLEELLPILPKVDSDALFRERNAQDNSTMGKLYNWGAFLARLSDSVGYDATLRQPDISVGGVLVAYGYLGQVELDQALEQRLKGETIGQALIRLELCSLDTIIEGVIGRSRLGSACARNPNKRLGTILLEEQVIDEKQLKQALFLQSQMKRPLGELLMKLNFCTDKDLKQALKGQRPIKAELPEADYLGEVLVQQGQLTRTDLLQALSEEQTKIKRPLGEILASMNWATPKSIKRALGWQTEKKRLLSDGTVRLGQVLIDLRFISSDILGQVLSEQVSNQKPLGQLLVEKGTCTPEQILGGIEEQLARRNRMAWQGDQGESHVVKVSSRSQLTRAKNVAVRKARRKAAKTRGSEPSSKLTLLLTVLLVLAILFGAFRIYKAFSHKPKTSHQQRR